MKPAACKATGSGGDCVKRGSVPRSVRGDLSPVPVNSYHEGPWPRTSGYLYFPGEAIISDYYIK